MKPIVKLAIVGLFASSVSQTVLATDSDPKEEAVEYRRAVFEVIKWNFVSIKNMIKGTTPFEATELAKFADRIAVLSKMHLDGFVPDSAAGSTKHKNEAKPEIWKKWDDFKAKNTKFEEESAKLAEVAKGGQMEQIKPQFDATAKSCKGCHDDYRKE
jgi:cytochrome c556